MNWIHRIQIGLDFPDEFPTMKQDDCFVFGLLPPSCLETPPCLLAYSLLLKSSPVASLPPRHHLPQR
ncbi:MAG: hypothetical protein ACK48U_08495, partial [Planctomyces sp.]